MVRGLPMALHPEGEGVSEMIRASGDFYEAAILDRLRELHPQQRVVVDAGANIGNHSLYWSAFQWPWAIWAFEPLPDNLALLERNLLPYPLAYCVPLALSDAPGSLRMTPNPWNMGASAVTTDGPVEVQAVTLDSFALDDVSLIKVDVEEHEERVLRGARETIERCHPTVLVEDWHGTCGPLLPGYRLVERFQGSNDLWEWAG